MCWFTNKLTNTFPNRSACTYVQGYITQPIYACATCTRGGLREPFGFCFGCSMNCHVDHDVYELFDKRHFRCDCGTPKSGIYLFLSISYLLYFIVTEVSGY